MSGNRKPLRNFSSGLHTNPENYDAFDVLNKTIQQSINGTKLKPGPYEAKVIKVLKETDPTISVSYKILAKLEIDNTFVPEVWSMPESKCFVGIENYFYPISDDIEMPWVGASVIIHLYDPENRIGVYTTLINSNFNNTDILGTSIYKKQANSLVKSFGD